MRRFSCLLAVLAALSSGCGAENDESPSDDAANGGDAGEPGATGGDSGSAGTSTGGAAATGGRATGGSSSDTGGSAGSAGASTGGAGGSASGTGGVAGTSAGSGGTSGSGSTSCDDPFVSEDISRLEATDAVDAYEVVGHNENDIRADMNANRPGDYDGLTTWTIRWSFQNCASPVWSVSLDVVYTMPNWEADDSDEIALIDAWTTYLDALYCHEYGHGRLAVRCANEVYDAVESIPGNSDCTALQTAAGDAVSSIIAACNARDIDYDAETNHGATMGAVFPR